jgi:hypothetical protein
VLIFASLICPGILRIPGLVVESEGQVVAVTRLDTWTTFTKHGSI